MKVTHEGDKTIVELVPEQLDCLYTALLVVYYYSSGTMKELAEQLAKKWPHIEPAAIDSYIEDCIATMGEWLNESQHQQE